MELEALVARLDAMDAAAGLEQLFALEQRVRAQRPQLADLMVVHRAAIASDGSRALLQRLGEPVGDTWLELLTPAEREGQPVWGHAGSIRWMRVEAGLLVTRGQDDGRLRRFDAAGVCHEDREASADDDARMLGDTRVSLLGLRVELHDARGERLLDSFELEAGDDYSWIERAQLLASGHVGLRIGEDDPGALYGPEYAWLRLDPRDRSRSEMPAPSEQLRFAGRMAVARPDGSLRLVEDASVLEPKRLHERRVSAVALGPERLVSASEDGICIHDRDGQVRARGRQSQRCIQHIVMGDPIVTTSSYSQASVHARPHARLWDGTSAEPGRSVDAGGRYADFITCDPTGARVAYTVDGVLHLRELSAEAEARALPSTWHWNRAHAWSEDGERFAIQYSGRAPTVWNLAERRRERILTTDVLDSAHFGVSEDGAVVTVDHSFYRLRALRVADGAALPSLQPGLNLSCSASRGSKGVAGGVAGGYWFDLATNARVCHKQGAWTHACAVGGPLAALAGSDGVYAVELETGELLWHWACDGPAQQHVVVVGDAIVCLDEHGQLSTLIAGELELQRPLCVAEGSQRLSMCGLPDRSVVVASAGGWLRRWDPFTGDLIDEWELGGVTIDELSHGGGKLLCRRWIDSSTPEWLAFELETGARVELPAGARQPRLTADGERLISLDVVARLDVFDARSGALLEQRPFGSWPMAEAITIDAGEVRACEQRWPSDGVHAVEARADGSLDVTREGKLLARWVGARAWCCAAIDGDRVVAGDAQGNVAVWALRQRC